MTTVRRRPIRTAALVALMLIASLLPTVAPTSVGAVERHPHLPLDSVEIPVTLRTEGPTWSHSFLESVYWWYSSCTVSVYADFDVTAYGKPAGDGTYAVLVQRVYKGSASPGGLETVHLEPGESLRVGSAGSTFMNIGPVDEIPEHEKPHPCENPSETWDYWTNPANVGVWTVGELTLTADFTHEADPDEPGNVTFSSFSHEPQNRPIDHRWDLGDGTIIEDTLTFTHTYERPGDYNVTLTVTDHDGDTDSVTQLVQVVAPTLEPVITIDGQDPDEVVDGIEPRVGDVLEVAVTVSASPGVGALSGVKPVGDILQLSDNLEIVEGSEPDVPDWTDGITLEPKASVDYSWLVAVTAAGNGSITTEWHGVDVLERPVGPARDQADLTAPPLTVDITASPDPMYLNVDYDGDDDVDEDDHEWIISATVTNQLDEELTDVTAVVFGDSPISLGVADGALSIAEAYDDHDAEFGTLDPGESVTIDYPFEAQNRGTAGAYMRVKGQTLDGEEVEGYGARTVVVDTRYELEVTMDMEDRPYRSGQNVRFNGTIENTTKVEKDGVVVDEGYPIGVIVYPGVNGNALNAFVVEESYGGPSPTEPVPFYVAPGETVSVRAIALTQEMTTHSEGTAFFEFVAYGHEEGKEPFPVLAEGIRVEGSNVPGFTDDFRFELSPEAPIPDAGDNCAKNLVTLGDYMSCRFVTGVIKSVTGLRDLAKVVGGGILTLGEAQIKMFGYGVWTMGQVARAMFLGDQKAIDRLTQEVSVNLLALQQLGVETLRGVALGADALRAKVVASLNEMLKMIETGDIKGIAGALSEFAGENVDMPFEWLIKARTASKLLEATTDVASPGMQAFQRELDDQAASLNRRVEDALNTGGNVSDFMKSGILKSGDRVTDVPALWRAMGLSRTDLDNLLRIASTHQALIAFRSRSAKAAELIENGLAWAKPGGVSIKTTNEIDVKYLGYRSDWEGKAVLVEPPVNWNLTGQARTDAVNAYLDRIPQLNSPSDFSRDLRAAVRERLEARIDEYPVQLQAHSKYLDEGIDTSFHVDKQGIESSLLPNDKGPNWDARLVPDSLPQSSPDVPFRRAFILEMSPPGANDFKPITGDIDFMGIFRRDGTELMDPATRIAIYQDLRKLLGMQHGETFTFQHAKRAALLSCCTRDGQPLLVANPDGHLYASYFRDDLSGLAFGPNDASLPTGYEPFVFMDGMIVEATSATVSTAGRVAGIPTATDRAIELFRAYKKYDPKGVHEKLVAADKQKDQESFDRLKGRILRIDSTDTLWEFLFTNPPGVRGVRSFDLPAGLEAASIATPGFPSEPGVPEFDEALAEILAGGAGIGADGRMGGVWVRVDPADVLGADGTLALTPTTYLTSPAPEGAASLEILSPAELRMAPDTPFFAVGDVVLVDPGGPGEQFAEVASLEPFTLTEPLEAPVLAGSAVVLWTAVDDSDDSDDEGDDSDHGGEEDDQGEEDDGGEEDGDDGTDDSGNSVGDDTGGSEVAVGGPVGSDSTGPGSGSGIVPGVTGGGIAVGGPLPGLGLGFFDVGDSGGTAVVTGSAPPAAPGDDDAPGDDADGPRPPALRPPSRMTTTNSRTAQVLLPATARRVDRAEPGHSSSPPSCSLPRLSLRRSCSLDVLGAVIADPERLRVRGRRPHTMTIPVTGT